MQNYHLPPNSGTNSMYTPPPKKVSSQPIKNRVYREQNFRNIRYMHKRIQNIFHERVREIIRLIKRVRCLFSVILIRKLNTCNVEFSSGEWVVWKFSVLLKRFFLLTGILNKISKSLKRSNTFDISENSS